MPIVAILFLSIFSWQALLGPGFFTMHDDQQVARLYELDKSLSAGQFPVRWVKDLGFGYGYPLFNFYPPLVYYTGEISHLFFNTSFIDSTKIVWFLALVGSALAMYFLTREFWGNIGAVVSSIFYLYAPYHAIDAYVRGALAELFSFVWLPLILLFSYQKKTVLTGVFLALLMLTHNLIFLPFLGLFVIWSFALKNYRFPISVLIALGLTAFFWAPALLEKQFTLVDQLLTKNLASYKIHFVCLNQLWDSPWGFGGSGPGCIDGLSFKIGKPHVIFVFLSLIVAFWKRSRLIFTLIFLFLVSVFMTTDFSRFVWNNIPPLWYLQFPWRFLEFAALFSSFLTGSLFLLVKNSSLKIIGAVVLIIALVIINAKYFVPQTFLPQATDSSLTADSQVKWHVSSTSFEYLPKDFKTTISDKGTVLVDVDESKIAKTDYQIISGSLNINKSQVISDKFIINASVTTPSTLQMQITNFPGWKVWLDEKFAPIEDNNPYRLITVNVLPGSHTITGKFTNTRVRTLGNLATLIFLAGLIFYGFRNRIRGSP